MPTEHGPDHTWGTADDYVSPMEDVLTQLTRALAQEPTQFCNICGDEAAPGQTLHFIGRSSGSVAEERPVCRPCVSRGVECQVCNRMFSPASTVTLHSRGGEDGAICRTCLRGDAYGQCYHCNHWYNTWETDCCVEETDDEGDGLESYEGCSCGSCQRARRNSGNIHNYSYKPYPIFHGKAEPSVDAETGREFDGALYMGFELEMVSHQGVNVPGRFVRAMNGGRDDESIVYLKSDSSINGFGFEMVTHPMTLDYAMTEFPWRQIRKFRRAGEISEDDSCGMHVHVSKQAFSGAAHEYRWIMFFYRNQQVMKRLARRDTHWANFAPGARVRLKDEVQRRHMGPTDHYDAINRGGDQTYEVRLFACTLFVNRLQANLQLVDATVEYTRSGLLTGGKKVSEAFGFRHFMSWLDATAERRQRYAQLREQMRALLTGFTIPAPQTMNARDVFAGWDARTGSAMYVSTSQVTQEGF